MPKTRSARRKPSPQVEARDALLAFIPVPREGCCTWKRIAFLCASVLLIALSFVMAAVPVAPGVIFGIPGLIMLGIGLPPVGRFLNRQEAKLPTKWRRKLRPNLWFRARTKLKRAAH